MQTIIPVESPIEVRYETPAVMLVAINRCSPFPVIMAALSKRLRTDVIARGLEMLKDRRETPTTASRKLVGDDSLRRRLVYAKKREALLQTAGGVN